MPNRTEAIRDIQRGKADPESLVSAIKPVQPGELPVALSDAHAAIAAKDAQLGEVNYQLARIGVVNSASRDAAAIEGLLKQGKLTVPVATKLVELSEQMRGSQLVHLSEGDPEAANADATNMEGLLAALGQLPNSVATEAAPTDPATAAAAGVDTSVAPAPGAPATDANSGDVDAKIDERARQIMKESGVSYGEALRQASAEAAQGAAPASAMGVN